MGRNWYEDWEDEQDEINESFGRDFVANYQKTEQQQIIKNEVVAKLYTHKNGQISLFKELAPTQRIGSNRGIEYIRLSKRDEAVKVRKYVEEYVPELEND